MYFFKKHLKTEEKLKTRVKNRRVHMANERTFLAWIRTSIGIMALGFVVEKFFLFPLCDPKTAGNHPVLNEAIVRGLGISLVFMGAGVSVLATYRFLRAEKEIIEDTYQPSLAADIIISFLLICISIFLALFLIFGA